ncbi:hypothetical protein FHS40_001511 [Streptomyces spectabilis]|uniref:Uncharacterized protein n=1 Tax=Streptomyces spectabilis TaxID=68270 RepID=A0A7W8ASJ5_STRST|nr:hypothetical protein [Streptomyces spectabilis]
MPESASSRPFLEIHIGGFHLVVQRVPVRLLAVLAAVTCSGFTAWWTSH